MLKKTVIFIIVFALGVSAYSYSRQGANYRTRGKEGGMILDLQKFNLGTLNNVEDKKQYLSIIQLEKQRIQNFSLKMVYEDAYVFYRKKDYQRALELAEAVLAIDPNYTPARTLADQAYLMGAYGTLSEAEIIDSKIEEGKRLYNAGRLVEAQRKFEEILTIQPYNSTAQSWIRKINSEIASEHERRGDVFYAKGDYESALDQWYSALLIRKSDSSLVSKISNAESQWRSNQVKQYMQEGMNYYSSSQYISAYNSFQQVLKVQPGEARATKFSSQIREELSSGYYSSCSKALAAGKYENAISNCQEAKKWGYSSAKADSLIAQARKSLNAAQAQAAATKSTKSQEITTTTITHDPAYDINDPRGILQSETTVHTIKGTTQSASGSARDYSSDLPTTTATRVTAEQAQSSKEAYRRGLAAYNEKDFITARKEWNNAKNLDPANSDAEIGLKKIDELEGR